MEEVRYGQADIPACGRALRVGYRFPDGLLAMLASLYSATLEEHILAQRISGWSISLYDQYKSLTVTPELYLA